MGPPDTPRALASPFALGVLLALAACAADDGASDASTAIARDASDASATDADPPPDTSLPDTCTRTLDRALVTDRELAELVGVHTLTGTLTITTTSTLDAVGCLEHIGGDLVISGVPALRDLSGLSALTTVGGALRVEVTAALERLDLPALERVGGDLHLDGNRAITRLDGLSRLHTVGGRVTISNHPRLSTIDAFAALTSMGGLAITFDPALEAVRGFDALDAIDGALRLHLTRTATLAGLRRLRHVRGDLELSEAPGAFGRSLVSLARIDGALLVSGDRLTALELPALETLGALRFRYGSAAEIRLPALTTLLGDATIREAPLLRELALPALAASTGTISLRANPALEAVDLPALVRARGLEVVGADTRPRVRLALELVDGPLVLERVDARSAELSGLSRARTVVLRDTTAPTALDLARLDRTTLVTITGNDGLEALELGALVESYDVAVAGNPALARVNLSGLSALGGRLVVADNPRLEVLELPRLAGRVLGLSLARNDALTRALFPLVTDAGALSVRGHRALDTLELPALARVDRDLAITDNARLSTCDIERLRDRVLAARGVGGRVEITGNAPCR